jgi:hypothetical protein
MEETTPPVPLPEPVASAIDRLSEYLFVIGAACAVVAPFLPWFGDPRFDGGSTTNGFLGGNWGNLHVEVAVTVAILTFLRTTGKASLHIRKPPIDAWAVYAIAAFLMTVSLAVVTEESLMPNGQSATDWSQRYGWWVAILAIVLLLLGVMLKYRLRDVET